jgi:hypothetical protein
MADIEDEEDRRYSEDGYGNPVRTIDPISALKEWLGMSFSEQENARKMGVESFPPGDHSFDYSFNGPPAQNVRQERPRYSGYEGLAGAFGGLVAGVGPTMNDARAPIPTPNFTEMLVQNASAGLLRALGKGGGPPVVNTAPPAAAPVLNYNAGLAVNGVGGSFGPEGAIPDQRIDHRANCSPGLLKALGL